MEVDEKKLDKPEDRLSIKYSGHSRELFMSYIRLNKILRLLPDATAALMILTDADLGEMTLRALLADKGQDMFEVILDEDAITSDDVETILMWAQDHVTYFFMRRFQQISEKAGALEPMARALQSSEPGSTASTSETPAAGPSA